MALNGITASEAPWHAAYPPPRNEIPLAVCREEVLHWLNGGKCVGKDFVLVDLRRSDNKGGTISGSINLPAQSLYSSIPTLYTIFAAAKLEKVIWYCGSSRGRGNRAAGWFTDYIEDQGNSTMKSYVLIEGVKGWAEAGDEYTQLMSEYQAKRLMQAGISYTAYFGYVP